MGVLADRSTDVSSRGLHRLGWLWLGLAARKDQILLLDGPCGEICNSSPTSKAFLDFLLEKNEELITPKDTFFFFYIESHFPHVRHFLVGPKCVFDKFSLVENDEL